MKISVTGRQMNVGEALTDHIESTIGELSTKYFPRPIEATVVLSKDHSHAIVTDIAVHISRGLYARVQHQANDAHLSFDGAVDKLDMRLRKYKTRFRDHHAREGGHEEVTRQASHYVLQNEAHEEAAAEAPPMVIAEMKAHIPQLTVSEAVMLLHITGEDVLVFHNSSHGEMNVVHRRSDGNVGWIDPTGNKHSIT